MSLIVAARFDSFESAHQAARLLLNQGYPEEALHTFYVNSAGAHDQYPIGGDQQADPDSTNAQWGALVGASVVGMIGALIGSLIAYSLGQTTYILILAGAVGAYIGSLAGALRMTGKRKASRSKRSSAPTDLNTAQVEHVAVRAAGVLLAVHVQPEQEAEVSQILKQADGKDVERASGRWTPEGWASFDPTHPPQLKDT